MREPGRAEQTSYDKAAGESGRSSTGGFDRLIYFIYHTSSLLHFGEKFSSSNELLRLNENFSHLNVVFLFFEYTISI